ncbi:MAG: hypothetical protein ACSHYA_11965 [Opitutaceae bacterium]
MKNLTLLSLATTAIFSSACSTHRNANSQDTKKTHWHIETQQDWLANSEKATDLEFTNGTVSPTAKTATYKSKIKRFPAKQSAKSLTISQSAEWLNWSPVSQVGPSNLGDAPVALGLEDGNYWMFGRYSYPRNKNKADFVGEDVTLEGFDLPLKTTPFKNQYDAPGGLKPTQRGYHAWQSRDMKTWVHHGAVSEYFSRWMTTAEYVDGKFYLYYDYPNDQDPHLYIDEDLTDGLPGTNMGMAFKDPTHGSDCAVIRDLDGQFHIIAEDWSPIKASKRSWDSPLATRAVSPDGLNDFKIQNAPVDYRTEPTGKIGTYKHPHWVKEDPDTYTTSVAEFEIHHPEQEAYGDWAAISIGGQYYLFGDYDHKEGEPMSVCWFTSDDINTPFEFCGSIGKGHPDPDILFAEGQFYLLTQQKTDYVSSGPWVETVEARIGADTNNDGSIDQWSDWQRVSEQYDYIEGFAKQIAKMPAQLNLPKPMEGYGFQFEIRISDSTENESKPVLDSVSLTFK